MKNVQDRLCIRLLWDCKEVSAKRLVPIGWWCCLLFLEFVFFVVFVGLLCYFVVFGWFVLSFVVCVGFGFFFRFFCFCWIRCCCEVLVVVGLALVACFSGRLVLDGFLLV